MRFEREIFKLSDGGTLALDWVLDEEGGVPRKNSSRPILACIAGLSGSNNNAYLISMLKSAAQHGYKCVVINFRGYSGVQLTSGKVFCAGLWEDFKEPIDYIHEKYCSDKEGYNQRNIYSYGVSLGAALLTLYLVNEQERGPLKGALIYSNPFGLKKNLSYFINSLYGFYNAAMGFNYNLIVKKQLLQLKPFVDAKSY